MHKCDNPACINPEHLKQGSHLENMQDMYSKGRRKIVYRGQSNGNSRLTNFQVKVIFKSKDLHLNLVKRYNVSRTTISDIKNKKIWKHLTTKL